MKVNVEVVWSWGLSCEEVWKSDGSSNSGEGQGLDSTGELEVVSEIEEAQVESLWVVLN